MTLELGDHVWYWNGNISFDKDIPRARWFLDSNPHDPNDYQGQGKEIYNYVIHADEIARGRPHMRNLGGSFAWLNNNPGNITGVPGGEDFGQYPGKFNWHNFLVFPTWAGGYNAIATLLRSTKFVNLSIMDAFKKYAPESDGNNPVEYANAGAAAFDPPLLVSTRIGDLDDAQMLVMQDKIQEIEGALPGESLSWDSDGIPPEIANQLPKSIRQARRPHPIHNRSRSNRGSPFSIDLSAPVDTSGFISGLGGPNQGGHTGPNWYIQYGMDIGADEGTSVYAAFDGKITRFQPHDQATDSGKVYGAQIFVRAPNDLMGGFYTHLTDVPAGLSGNSVVARGDLLGRVYKFGGITPHLHLALVEIIGGAPSGQYLGVDLYQLVLDLQSSEPETVIAVQFSQDGSPPEPLLSRSQGRIRGIPISPKAMNDTERLHEVLKEIGKLVASVGDIPGHAIPPPASPGHAIPPPASPARAIPPPASSARAIPPPASSARAIPPPASPGRAIPPPASPARAIPPPASPGHVL